MRKIYGASNLPQGHLRALGMAIGLATRFAALSLSFVNIVAVVSFWHVLAENDAAAMSHFYWGLLLLMPLCHGPGKLSLDHWIWTRLTPPLATEARLPSAKYE